MASPLSLRRLVDYGPTAQGTVDRERTTAANDHDQRQRHGEDVKLEAFTLLLAAPVHEEAHLPVHGDDGHKHVDGNGERRDTTQLPNDQRDAAKEFRNNREPTEERRNAETGVEA